MGNRYLISSVELIITTILFYLGGLYSSFNVSVVETIMSILLFIIVFELVRSLVEYVMVRGEFFKVRYLIDGSILFFLREVMLMFQKGNFKHILIAMLIIIVLSIFRYIELYVEHKKCGIKNEKS